jgi:hypothetical protein
LFRILRLVFFNLSLAPGAGSSPAEVAPFRKDRQRDDGADAWDATQRLIVSGVNEQVISHALDLISLADQASGFGDDHPEHADGRRVSCNGSPMDVRAVS